MNKKLMSLLLVLVLALPMVFVTVNALAAETEYYNVVRTSGGRLNVWPQPVKKAGSSSKSLKNGTPVTVSGAPTYSTADKRWMVYITSPVTGWVDKNYIGKKAVVPAVEIKPTGKIMTEAKLVGTAPNSQINLWATNLLPFERRWQKPSLASIPLDYVFKNAEVWNNGTTKVTFVTADLEEITGFVRTEYLVDLTPVPPKAK